MEGKQQKHFVLIHGSCHGAWCWFKLQTLLEAAGHRVTVIDFSAASGMDPKSLKDVPTFIDYTLPLFEIMESIPPDEKVVLVGHSYGGINLAFAMDKYPQKISVAVFVTAYMPDTVHRPSYVLEQYFKRYTMEYLLDTQTIYYGKPEDNRTAVLFGPKFMSTRLYQLSPPEDLNLAKTLVRPTSLFLDELSNSSPLSNEGYGSVKRAFIICASDKGIPKEFQLWLIKNFETPIVKEIKDADHMAMISSPHKLCQYLLEIANVF
ncbi:salicylic acid-binding protein 2-like isoform X1 [Olea europaea var. sylvestris]|uniref:salicylic acid-binding protein 2-like isoform X1 n=1 Tax=Olea europaea var. sylvestris TaxID=158386 RepID=UPI000C1D2BE5|nr:salicylic acid-binding protein 2-like isoform X1 [Olea europaea var. sylvestris]